MDHSIEAFSDRAVDTDRQFQVPTFEKYPSYSTSEIMGVAFPVCVGKRKWSEDEGNPALTSSIACTVGALGCGLVAGSCTCSLVV